jgi:hypothetical protein
MYETATKPISPIAAIPDRSGMDWVKKYVENVIKFRAIELVKPIQAMMAARGVLSFHIAGGALYRGQLNDVDIWPTVRHITQYNSFVSTFKKDNHSFGEMTLDGVKYQFCMAPVNDNTEALVKDFDFAHCQVGAYIELSSNGTIDVADVTVTPDFIAAMALQTTWYTPGHHWPLHSLARVGKVAKKLNLSTAETKGLCNQIVSDILNRGLENCAKSDPDYIKWLKQYNLPAVAPPQPFFLNKNG